MSKNIISFIVLNGITTSFFTFIYNYIFVKKEKNDTKIDILIKKINTLENSIQ